MALDFSRRQFLAATGAAVALSGLTGPSAFAQKTPEQTKPRVCIFSKHLQYLDYDALADQCAALGVDVDLTVRAGGHVEPERVKDDLPKAVEILRGRGVEVPMITTLLKSGADPYAADILETASKLRIGYFRIGGHKYAKTGNPLAEMEPIKEDLISLGRLAEAWGMFAGYHNHSGENNVGAPVWDLLLLFRGMDNPRIGSNFDIGHATVEGAYGDWQITTRAMADYINMVAVKDFEWRRGRPRWVPLGEGLVNFPGFFEILHSINFAGPISLHFEYPTRNNEELVEHIAAAAKFVREALAEVGYA